MTQLTARVLIAVVLSLAGACGDDDEGRSVSALLLDPTESHYGLTNNEWQVRWWRWIYEVQQQDADHCIIPIDDPTGEHCSYGQPPGEVFFLAGTSAGSATRSKCVVPSGKALYFPILTFINDNAGRAPEERQSDSALRTSVQTLVDAVPVDELSVQFDGTPIPDLARFRTEVTEFSYQLPPEPNVYTCFGGNGVTGEIKPSYVGGFYVMLAPPMPGKHVLHFKGSSPASTPPLHLDVTYEFKVE